METKVIRFGELSNYPLLERFWEDYFNKAVDSMFKEKKFAFCDIFYHNGFAAYFVRDDFGNKIGIVVGLQLNEQKLFLVPNDFTGNPEETNEYFKNGFDNMGYHILRLEIRLFEESYLQQFKGNQNYRTYLGKNPNYWAILEDKNGGGKLYVSFPNISPLKIA